MTTKTLPPARTASSLLDAAKANFEQYLDEGMSAETAYTCAYHRVVEEALDELQMDVMAHGYWNQDYLYIYDTWKGVPEDVKVRVRALKPMLLKLFDVEVWVHEFDEVTRVSEEIE